MGKLFIAASSHRGTGKALNRNKYYNCLEDTFKAENNAYSKCSGTRGREEIRVLAKGAYQSIYQAKEKLKEHPSPISWRKERENNC